MGKEISATYANRNFPRILRDVKDGRSYVVTSRGRPVARISRVSADSARRALARAALLKRLQGQPAINIGRWTREELYER